MKQQIKKSIVLIIFSFITFYAVAQEKPVWPKWVSANGYWVVQGNVKTPLDNTIRFYNNQGMLIYTEVMEGIKLNVQKRKTKMKLKEVLETALVAWQKNKQPGLNQEYVVTVFKQ